MGGAAWRRTPDRPAHRCRDRCRSGDDRLPAHPGRARMAAPGCARHCSPAWCCSPPAGHGGPSAAGGVTRRNPAGSRVSSAGRRVSRAGRRSLRRPASDFRRPTPIGSAIGARRAAPGPAVSRRSSGATPAAPARRSSRPPSTRSTRPVAPASICCSTGQRPDVSMTSTARWAANSSPARVASANWPTHAQAT